MMCKNIKLFGAFLKILYFSFLDYNSKNNKSAPNDLKLVHIIERGKSDTKKN